MFLWDCKVFVFSILVKWRFFYSFSPFQCLIKPAIKERTEPIDLVLHSDVRALERAEFDHHVSLLKTHFTYFTI